MFVLQFLCITGALPALCAPVVKLKTTPGPPYDLPHNFTNAGSNDRDGCMPLGPYPDYTCGPSYSFTEATSHMLGSGLFLIF